MTLLGEKRKRFFIGKKCKLLFKILVPFTRHCIYSPLISWFRSSMHKILNKASKFNLLPLVHDSYVQRIAFRGAGWLKSLIDKVFYRKLAAVKFHLYPRLLSFAKLLIKYRD